MRKLLLILVLLGLAGIAALFFAERAPTGSSADEQSVVDSVPPPGAKESAVDPGLTTAAAPSEREELAPPAPVGGKAIDPSLAHLSVHAIDRTSRNSLAQVYVSLHDSSGPKATNGVAQVEGRGDLERGRTTGVDGLVAFALPSGRELRLHATNMETGVRTNIRVRPLLASEQRELLVEIPDMRDAPLMGRVVSADGGGPIPGARVRVDSGAAGKDLRTDDEGRFEIRLPNWGDPHLRVEAEGYGPRIVSTGGDHADLEHALTIPLSHSATLHAHVLGASGAAIAGARIELSAHGDALRYDEAQEHGLVDRDLSSLRDEHWEAETAADGFATIADLPSRVELALLVTGDAGRVLRREPVGLRLEAGELRELELLVGAGTRISGRVLDQQKQPVAGAELWLVKAEPPEQRRIYGFDGPRAAAKALCDADGTYVFSDVPAGSWLIGPAAYYPTEKTAGPDSIAGVAALVQLSGEPGLTLDLRVSRGLLIGGSVVGPDGAPVSDAQVTAQCESGGNMAFAATRSDGGFVIGPLEPESYAISATDRGHFAPTDEVQVRPGEQHLVLRLKPSGKLRGKVVDETSGAACAAHVVVRTDSADRARGGNVALVKDDGEFELAGIALGPCTVTASTTDGRFAQVHAEVFSDRVSMAPLLSLAHGGTLRVHSALDGDLSFFAVTWNGAIVLFGEDLHAGKTMEMPAPAGKLALRFATKSPKPVHDLSIDLARGETKEITLKDED